MDAIFQNLCLYLRFVINGNTMSHNHNHNHSHAVESLGWVYYLAIGLNFGYVILEAVVGLCYNSMGLLSDAGHKLIDVFSLVIALVAFKLASSKCSRKYTYGYRKTSILISLLNALLLLAAVLIIIYESIEKMGEPSEVSGAAISWTAAVGIVVSGISALLLMNHRKGDINTRGAFLHMATDSLISLGVVISGIVINFTGWYMLDPIVSILIALVILKNTLMLLRDSFKMSIDAVPDGVSYDDTEKLILECGNVESVDELHIWSVSVTEKALTARVKLSDYSKGRETVERIRKALAAYGMGIVTIESY